MRATSFQNLLPVLVFVGASLLAVSGCRMTVLDEERSLIKYEPIGGALELAADKHIDRQGTGSMRRENENTAFTEKLTLETEGDVYHKNLLTYTAALALGLRQHISDFDGDTDKGSGTLNEYNLSGRLLRTQPYPMRFYLGKSEQFIPRLFTSTLRSERRSAGGTLWLRLEDWPMQFQYGESQTNQRGLGSRDLDRYVRENESFSYSLDHAFSKFSNLSFDFERDDVTQERLGSVFHRKEDRYDLRHDLLFGDDKQHQFGSYFNFLDQSGDSELEQLRWQERLRLRHSDIFQTYYGFVFDESERPTFKNDRTQFDGGFTYRLFQSLVTTGNIYTSQANLNDDVEVTREGYKLGFDYRKKNPWGTFLANYTVGSLNLEQEGGSTLVNVVDERHPFVITGSLRIQLDRTNVDASSIVVMDSGRTKIYTDYTVSQNNGITEILIIPGGDITTDGNQTLSIDYDFFTDPERDEEASTQSLMVRERFHNGLSLYYEYRSRDERLRSADTDIVPNEFEINTFGTDYINKGLRLLGEYSRNKSTRIPSRSKRLEASYAWRLNPDTKVNVYASNSWIDYMGTNPYDITLLTFGAAASSRLTDNYSIFGNIDYRNEDDTRQGTTEGFQSALELRYDLRQLSIRTGVEFNSLDRFGRETDNTFLYLRLKRIF
ncbi:MAG: hypothetical protein ACYSW8_00795 [Planctomycetota bacterium]|jgi:hypothetical protein